MFVCVSVLVISMLGMMGLVGKCFMKNGLLMVMFFSVWILLFFVLNMWFISMKG